MLLRNLVLSWFIIGCLLVSKTNSQCNLSISVPADITVCDEQISDLIGSINGDYFDFMWEGDNRFLNTTDIVTQDFTTSTTAYTFSVRTESPTNLIINGDFEGGNTGFTTQYAYSNPTVTCTNGNHGLGPLGCEGTYLIVSDPSTTHTNFSSCSDHTTGSGNMMAVNGANSLSEIWCQTVSVNPNTDYAFRAWATSIEPSSPAILQFSIDGALIGNNFNLSGATCSWESFYALWNSGPNTSIEICVTNQNLAGGGNDFALDDIFFGEVCTEEETFTVTIQDIDLDVDPLFEINCEQTTVDIDAYSSIGNLTYNWFTSNGQIIGSTTNSFIQTGTAGIYEVLVTDDYACTALAYAEVIGDTEITSGSVIIQDQLDCSHQNVLAQIIPDQNDVSIRWTGLNEDSTGFDAVYDSAGMYSVILTNASLCVDTIPFTIEEEIINVETSVVDNPPIRCSGDSSYTIVAISVPYSNLTWIGDGIDSISDNGLQIIVDQSGVFTYSFDYGNGCSHIDSVEISSFLDPLEYSLPPPPILDCNITQVKLSIESDSFQINTWFDDTGILGQDSLIVEDAGIYRVVLVDQYNCTYEDSIQVFRDTLKPSFWSEIDSIDCLNGRGYALIQSDSINHISWLNQQGVQVETDTFFYSQATTLLGSITAPNGCTDSITLEIPASLDFPIVSLNFNDIDCGNPQALISASADISGSIFEWTLPDGNNNSSTNFESDIAGEYTLEVISPKGCTYEESFTIAIDTVYPIISLSSNKIDCIDTLSLLEASINGPTSLSQWVTEDGLNIVNDNFASTTRSSWFYYIAQGENECITIDSVFVEVDQTPPRIDPIDNQLITCVNQQVNIAPTLETSYIPSWNKDQEGVFSTASQVEIEESGWYELIVIDTLNGCENSTSFIVEIDTHAIQYQIEYNDINCSEPTSTIRIVSQDSISTLEAPSTLIEEDSFTYRSTAGGQYEFLLAGQNHCPNKQSIDIKIDTIKPIIETYSDTLLCDNSTIPLRSNIDIQNPIVSWTGPQDFASTNKEAGANHAGEYRIQVINPINGCISESELTLFPNPTEIIVDQNLVQPICFGDPGIYSASNIHGGKSPYSTTILSEDGEVIQGEIIERAGFFFVEIEDAKGCAFVDSFVIESRSPIDLELGPDIEILKGNETQLLAQTNLTDSDIDSIDWNPTSYLTCFDCLNPFTQALNANTVFELIITDIHGCKVRDDIEVRVNIKVDIIAPNVFSPNQDGTNDGFTLYTENQEEVKEISSLLIYDRWGALVFQKNAFPINVESEGWQGEYRNQAAISGVYVYVAEVLISTGEKRVLKGDVTLIR